MVCNDDSSEKVMQAWMESEESQGEKSLFETRVSSIVRGITAFDRVILHNRIYSEAIKLLFCPYLVI